MLISTNLHKKSSEVSIKTRSSPDSFLFKGQATKHTTVKWSIPLSNVRVGVCGWIISLGRIRFILIPCSEGSLL